MLKFAGVALNLLPDDYASWLGTYHSLDDFVEDGLWDFDRSGIWHLPLPPPPDRMELPVGTLVWPTSLTRCAIARYVIDTEARDRINAELGESAGPADLVIADGLGNSRTFSLYKLACRPLSTVGNANGTHLLTLVDARWYRRNNTGSITSTLSSWASLLSSLASQMGVSLSVDSVHSAYGTPTAQWKCVEKPLAPLIDAVCHRIGHRLVANLDGTFSTVNYATASALADAQSGLTKTAGGLIARTDLTRSVPASIKVVFRNSSGTVPYSVTKTLSGLAISDYGDATGVSGASDTVFAELVYDGTNATACDDYAERAATDWYNWQLIDLDLTLTGAAEWEPTGAEDRIEWKHYADRILTRVVRGPLQSADQGSLGSTGTLDPQDDCEGCGWLAALKDTDCLLVSVVEATGDCDCAFGADPVFLTTSDGQTWSSAGGSSESGGGGGVTLPDTITCCPDRESSPVGGSVAFSSPTGTCSGVFSSSTLNGFNGGGTVPAVYTSVTPVSGTDWYASVRCKSGGSWDAFLTRANSSTSYLGSFVSANCDSGGSLVVVFDFSPTGGLPCTGTVRATFTLS